MSNRIYPILVYLQVDICQRYTLRLSIYINFISQNFILHTSFGDLKSTQVLMSII